MIQEMERAIAKREQIAVRYKGKSEAAAGRSTKARRGMLASGDGGAGSGLGDLTTTALKKKVHPSNNSAVCSDRRRCVLGSSSACFVLCVRANLCHALVCPARCA